MSGSKEIVGQIKSIKNTRKVTRALEMVSASKIRKAQERMEATRPYARLVRQAVGHLAHANPDYKHPFMQERDEIKRVGYIIISSDRGLCGGLNNNMFRQLLPRFREHEQAGQEVSLVLVGKKGQQFFKRIRIEIAGTVQDLGEQPQLEKLIGAIKIMLDGYRDESLDKIYLCYNDFINTMTQRVSIDQLLPLPPATEEPMLKYWDYIYEPNPESLLDDLLVRYIESLVYNATLENLASEHAARMVAMKNASDNANNLIDDLNLAYNKARQAAITQEISEIVSGAAAV